MPQTRQERIVTALVTALVIGAAVIAATHTLFRPWPLWGHSSGLDAARLFELDRGLRAGALYPRWAPDMYAGYGSPLLAMYAPWGYYVAWPFHALGLTQTLAMKCSYLLAVLGAALGMFALARRIAGRDAGLLCAIVYVFSPYLLADLYARAAIAELWGFALIPWIVFGHVRYADDGDAPSLALATLAHGVLGCAHNISFLIYTPLVGLVVLLRTPRARWIAALGAIGAALALSAFFWLPALALKDAVQSEKHLTTGFFAFTRHFVPAFDLVRPHWGFGAPGGEDGVGMSRQLGLLHWAALAGALVAAIRVRAMRRDAAVFLALAAIGLAFTNRITAPMWEHLPLIRFVQFPWRFLMVATFASTVSLAIVFAALRDHFGERWTDTRRLGAMGVVIVAATILYSPYASARYLLLDLDTLSYRMFDAEGAASAAGEAVGEPRFATFDQFLSVPNVRAANITGMASDDFLPVAVTQKPARPAASPWRLVDGDADLDGRETGFCRYEARVTVRTHATVALEVFWFPGWTVRVDGARTKTAPLAETGVVSVSVEPGEHELVATYERAEMHRIADAISLLALALVVGGVAVDACRRRRLDIER
ncbi:MAG: hypothetical protein KJ042_07745 [Deltaproteobacteria bacterium]|nr:hypothetical protein [Deltaproteobacteria bacterium]